MNAPFLQPIACTLTGIDEWVNLNELWEISGRHPNVEWGVLLSTSRAGKGRYPRLAWIAELAQEIRRRPGARFALHVCGGAVDRVLAADAALSDLLPSFNRVQLNLCKAQDTALRLRCLLEAMSQRVFITQENAANAGLWAEAGAHRNHQLLFDASGGRGETPIVWPVAPDGPGAPAFGYAGGLGPENLLQQLPEILKAAGGRAVWLDMESRLRDEADRFHLGLARLTLRELDRAVQSPPRRVSAHGAFASWKEAAA